MSVCHPTKAAKIGRNCLSSGYEQVFGFGNMEISKVMEKEWHRERERGKKSERETEKELKAFQASLATVVKRVCECACTL